MLAGRSEGGNRVEAIRQAALPQIERRSRLSNRAMTGHPVIGNSPLFEVSDFLVFFSFERHLLAGSGFDLRGNASC